MEYLVITEVPAEPSEGNLSMPMSLVYVDTVMTEEPEIPRWRDFGLGHLALRQPVFTVGEVIITDDGERECIGHGRKPSKWDVKYQTFDSIDDAVAFAKDLQSAPQEPPAMMKVCVNDGEPLVSDMSVPQTEWICMRCAQRYAFLDGRSVPATPELQERHAELVALHRGDKV